MQAGLPVESTGGQPWRVVTTQAPVDTSDTTDLDRAAAAVQVPADPQLVLPYSQEPGTANPSTASTAHLPCPYPCQVCQADNRPTHFVTWFWGEWHFILCEVCSLLAQIGALANRLTPGGIRWRHLVTELRLIIDRLEREEQGYPSGLTYS